MPTIDLERFPRPGLTVDLAILTVAGASDTDPSLRLLVQERTDPDGHALPGGFVRERWTIERTVEDVLRRKVGISPSSIVRPHLLRVFDDPDRDDRTWAISIAHSVSLREADLLDARGDLLPLGRRVPDERSEEGVSRRPQPTLPTHLLFDHDRIVEEAVAALRERYEIRHRPLDARPDPDGFLTPPFTLHQLRRVHEAVVGDELHKDNFNRRMKPLLEPVLHRSEPVLSDGLRGRPAALYRPLKEAARD